MSEKDGKHSNSADAALFREAVGDSEPLISKQRHQGRKAPPPARAMSRHADDARVLQESLQPPADIADVETGDELIFRRNHLPNNRFRELRRGQIPAEDSLDLHGLNVTQAQKELRDYIVYCHRKGYRCVRVVHGKGLGSGARGPVLKNGVNTWLRNWDEVQAFCSAPAHDGGTGAAYVLLTRT
jgi:DNA-nicking Smr family endonuclease